MNIEAGRSRIPWIVCALAAPLLVATLVLSGSNGSLTEDVGFIVLAVAMILGYLGVGSFVASRAPRNPVGWLMMTLGLTFLGGAFTDEFLTLAETRPDRILFEGVVTWLHAWGFVPGIASMPLILLLLPNGEPLSRRWRPVVAAAVMAGVLVTVVSMFAPGVIESSDIDPSPINPLGIDALEPLVDLLGLAGLVTLLVTTVLGVVSLVVRWRRSIGVERQQVRVFVAVVMLAGLLFLAVLATSSGGASGTLNEILFLAFFVCLGIGVPAAMGVAILRYRMYDVEVVIRKTVRFAIVAAVLAGAMGGALFLIGGPVLGILVGGSGDLDMVFLLSGLAIGALVVPLWRVSRKAADRLVFGGRATPYEVLTEFSQRVGESYTTEDVLPRMAAVLGSAVGADRADIWLGVGASRRHAAGWPEGTAADRTGTDIAPIGYQGEELGCLSVVMPANDPMDPSKEHLMADLAAQAGPVLRNVRLVEDLRESRRRIVTAQDERARALERNIHDGAQQQLVALAVKARLATSLAERDPARVAGMLEDIQVAANDALEDLRDLARGIYPPLLADQGLTAAIDAQARKAALAVTVSSDGVQRYPQDVEAAVYFCVLEALNNVAKYAGATRVDVRLGSSDSNLRFEVTDDGVGFDPVHGHGAGTGLQGMTDRMEALGGSLSVTSRPGDGTTVSGAVPA